MPFTYTEKARISLERAKRSKIIRSYLDQQGYVRILQAVDDGVPFHKKYWCANASGYTAAADQAGIYTGAAAWAHAKGCDPSKAIVFAVLRQKDERTQEEMPGPRLEFKGSRKEDRGQFKFWWQVDQIMSQGREGRSLSFCLVAWWTPGSDAISWDIDFAGELPRDLAQAAKWHRAVAHALANLPKARLELPLW